MAQFERGLDRNPVQQQANRSRLQFQTFCSVRDYAMSRSASGTYLDHLTINAFEREHMHAVHGLYVDGLDCYLVLVRQKRARWRLNEQRSEATL